MHLAEVEGEAKVSPNGACSDWMTLENTASWTVRINQPGKFEVMVKTFGRKRAPASFGNHQVKVTIAGNAVEGTAGVKDLDLSEDAPGPQKPESSIGTLEITSAGEHEVKLITTKVDETALKGFSLFALKLIPKK
jgi:hypothetical protein